MEFFRFCLEIIEKESKRFNVGINSSTAIQLTAANADDVNYDKAHNRCAFLYRCGTINLALAKDCFSKFLSDCNALEYLLAKWKPNSSLIFCSLSKGPALDYIALLLSHAQCRILTSSIQSIRIISKYGAWRNSANIMLDMINKGYFKDLPPSVGNIEVIQGDPFNNFTEKVQLPINDSDVVMMMKALNLQSDGYDQGKISQTIQEFLDAMKPGAVLFCVDTKPSIKEITHLLTTFPGKFLLQPTFINTMVNLEYTDLFKAHFGCNPITSGRGSFFVWEKSLVSSPKMKCQLNEFSKTVQHIVADKKCDKVVTAKSNTEITCKEAKNFDPLLAKHFSSCSTPKLGEESGTANVFDYRKRLLHLADSAICSNSSTDGSLSERLNTSLSSLRSELDIISNDICKQTEPEELLRGTEINKIAELTDKITNLTVEMTKLLENNISKHCASDSCCRNSEEICNPPNPAVDSCSHCSSVISNSRFPECSQNFRMCCCSQKYACQESHLSSSHGSSNASICDEALNFCNLSNSTRSNYLSENTSAPTAQLVIPLTNLSADVASQIISLIAQSNQNSKKD